MRIALGLEYDGSTFCGWQTQPSGCSVQDAVDAAVSEIAAHPVQSQCAGRTDAGVHALGQVAHFDTSAQRPLSAWVRGVNALLPKSIAVQWAREVSGDFHARGRATGRVYNYLLLNRHERPGVHHARIGWHHRPLELATMQAAANCLIGTHDFSAFRAAECQAATPLKQLRRAKIHRYGALLLFEFAADAFLHHMVRNMAGTLLEVGRGSIGLDQFRDLFIRRDRNLAGFTAPAHGLILVKVRY